MVRALLVFRQQGVSLLDAITDLTHRFTLHLLDIDPIRVQEAASALYPECNQRWWHSNDLSSMFVSDSNNDTTVLPIGSLPPPPLEPSPEPVRFLSLVSDFDQQPTIEQLIGDLLASKSLGHTPIEAITSIANRLGIQASTQLDDAVTAVFSCNRSKPGRRAISAPASPAFGDQDDVW